MLTYFLDSSQKAPLYEQLSGHIKQDILSGTLKQDEKLPSKRAIAGHLGVSVITVETAYETLLMEGYIYSRPRQGFFVADISDVFSYLGRTGKGAESVRDTGARAAVDRRKVKNEQRQMANVMPIMMSKDDETASQSLSNASINADTSTDSASAPVPDTDSFPFSIWARLSRQVLSDQKEELLTNAPAGGVAALREAIAAHLRSFRKIDADPAQIIIGSGTEYLDGLLVQLLGMDLIYAYEDPGYAKLKQVLASYGVRSRAVPIDGQGLSVKALRETGASIVCVTPSHHFPTGIVMPINRRYELLNWAAEEAADGQRRYILEDDYNSELNITNRTPACLFSMDHHGCVIYMNTFTTTLASTMRISYMVLPKALARRYYERLSFYSCTVPNLEQYTLAAFIREGYFEKHINRLRSAAKRDAARHNGVRKQQAQTVQDT